MAKLVITGYDEISSRPAAYADGPLVRELIDIYQGCMSVCPTVPKVDSFAVDLAQEIQSASRSHFCPEAGTSACGCDH